MFFSDTEDFEHFEHYGGSAPQQQGGAAMAPPKSFGRTLLSSKQIQDRSKSGMLRPQAEILSPSTQRPQNVAMIDNTTYLGAFELQEKVVHDRPTYKKLGEKMYLYSTGDSWLVGNKIGQETGQWKAESTAMTPDTIEKSWQKLIIQEWVDQSNVKIVQMTAPINIVLHSIESTKPNYAGSLGNYKIHQFIPPKVRPIYKKDTSAMNEFLFFKDNKWFVGDDINEAKGTWMAKSTEILPHNIPPKTWEKSTRVKEERRMKSIWTKHSLQILSKEDYKWTTRKDEMSSTELIELLNDNNKRTSQYKISRILSFNLNYKTDTKLTITLNCIVDVMDIILTCELVYSTLAMGGSPLQNNLFKIVVALRNMGNITNTLFDDPGLSGILYTRDYWTTGQWDITRYNNYCRNQQNDYYITSFNKTRGGVGYWDETINALNEIENFDLKFYVCNKNNEQIAQYLQYCADFKISNSEWKKMNTTIQISDLKLQQLTPDHISQLNLNKIYTLYPAPQSITQQATKVSNSSD